MPLLPHQTMVIQETNERERETERERTDTY